MKPDEAIKRIQDHMERHEIGKYPHVKLEEALAAERDAYSYSSREEAEKAAKTELEKMRA